MLDHQHLIVNCKVKKPLTCTTATSKWLTSVVEKIGMKIVAGPITAYCDAEKNEGITGACCVQTSHLSVHVWDKVEVPFMRLDVYSCKTFNDMDVVNMLQEFEPFDINVTTLDRNHETYVKQVINIEKL